MKLLLPIGAVILAYYLVKSAVVYFSPVIAFTLMGWWLLR